MATETEIKLAIPDSEIIPRLLEDELVAQYLRDPLMSREMYTSFYDTADFALEDCGLMLRIRSDGRNSIATVKTRRHDALELSEEGVIIRSQWSVVGDDPEIAVRELVAAGAPEAVLECTRGVPLVEYCTAEFTRTMAVLHMDDGVHVELAIDDGYLISGENRLRMLELELELLFGSMQGLLGLSRSLAEVYGLTPDSSSKYRKALSLAGRGDQLQGKQ